MRGQEYHFQFSVVLHSLDAHNDSYNSTLGGDGRDEFFGFGLFSLKGLFDHARVGSLNGVEGPLLTQSGHSGHSEMAQSGGLLTLPLPSIC